MKIKRPVETGQVIVYEITGIAHNGVGVGKYQGFTVFTPYTVPGERIKAEIIQVKKNYAVAKMLDVENGHSQRVNPSCPIFKECGGCQLQHISYETQLALKRQQVVDNLERIGGFKNVLVHPVLGMKEPWRYRNKVQVPIGIQNGRTVAGFYRAGSHEIIEMDQCLIQPEESDQAVRLVKQLADQLGITPYDEKKHQGILRHVMVRTGIHTQEMMIVLVTNGESLPNKKEFIQRLHNSFPQMRSLIQNINTKRTNVILGEKNKLLWGEPVIYDHIGSVRYAISPHSFFQINPVQTEVLYEQVRKYAALTGEEVIIDAYCGIGTIALYLAEGASQVYGVEIVPEAIRDAKVNAEINGYTHVHFEVGAAEKVMPRWLEEGVYPDVVIVDPPRKGCQPELLDAITGMKPKRLIYVSCNPATLARDVKYLQEQGYYLQEVQPVDMFPQTMHVESVALLTLR
ncbi:23S rRNA (uracil(1939)-C(5))-methyltransferase RlmD [Thermoflavimicrobium daqui]|uniref:23S rRNA (Uracil(1939)-C(5))-methyltransferase RlmD n=1 Tax=Thermoflavimicrobium daqui TaxID=2137476 RepID=A0A364K1A1_9BACL|nr:23S rRNA (uracil(1939)-C(5))-methyltransferase RlmD [Thermoflavimicrobium daqui]RAL21472.1 23S rRNA (uracil(1939)-C(5))-methyltransferase RlmD [Thermoflavimicrobium daqui]